jgi:RNA polymerase sigma factor (sigma-70 family)
MSVLSRLLESDSTAFARMDRAARRMCKKFMSQPADVDGATQDAWVKAWDHGDALKNESAAEGWIARIAQRVCFQRLMKRRRERLAYHTLAVDETTSGVLTGLRHTDTPVLDQELEDEIHSLMLALPERERRIILERALFPNRKWSIIAQHHGLSEAAAKKTFYRTRPKLLRQLNELRDRYMQREEPLPENRPPAMYVYTLDDFRRTCEDLSADAQAEIIAEARLTLPRRRNYGM